MHLRYQGITNDREMNQQDKTVYTLRTQLQSITNTKDCKVAMEQE